MSKFKLSDKVFFFLLDYIYYFAIGIFLFYFRLKVAFINIPALLYNLCLIFYACIFQGILKIIVTNFNAQYSILSSRNF